MSALKRLLKRIESSQALDRPAGVVAELLPAALRAHPVVDVLRGRFLGHPVHPVLVLLPISMYTASAVLDVVPGEGGASRGLIGVGLAATPAAVASGLAEYTTLDERQRRTALVHLASNALATVAYLTSFRLRGDGYHVVGRAVGAVGLGLVGLGGLLGGHLSYAQGAGVRREPV
jgi:uncharacterized membrane protein